MNTRLICISIAAVMGFSPLAQARDWQRHGDRDGRRWEQQHPGQRHGQGHRHDRHGWQHDRGRPAVVHGAPQHYPYQPRHPSWPAYGYGQGYGSVHGHYGNQVQVVPAVPYYYGHSAVPRVYAPRYYQGGYLPREYLHGGYVVNDWRSHRLYAPPHGHQWMRVGSDYLLVAIATGLIVSLLLGAY